MRLILRNFFPSSLVYPPCFFEKRTADYTVSHFNIAEMEEGESHVALSLLIEEEACECVGS